MVTQLNATLYAPILARRKDSKMAAYTISVDDKQVALFDAFCKARGQAGIREYVQHMVDGHLAQAVKESEQSDLAAQAAKLEAYEQIKPMADKYGKLEKADQEAVDLILAKADVAVEEPIGG
jgi:hypothetical protein